MAQRRTWVLVLFGAFVLIVVIGIGGIIATTMWFQQNVTVEGRAEGEAMAAFDVVRQRYAGRAPLLEMRDGRPARNNAGQAGTGAQITTLHILVWDPDDSQFTDVSVPFWVLRMQTGTISFNEFVSDIDDSTGSLSAEDLERYGPGIVLDTTLRSGERLLLWAE